MPVLPKAAGFVTEVRVRDNQQVKAGDVLVELDKENLRAQVRESSANLQAAKAAEEAAA